jgi:hypothetical protein
MILLLEEEKLRMMLLLEEEKLRMKLFVEEMKLRLTTLSSVWQRDAAFERRLLYVDQR